MVESLLSLLVYDEGQLGYPRGSSPIHKNIMPVPDMVVCKLKITNCMGRVDEY
jgi:hypothetical protein